MRQDFFHLEISTSGKGLIDITGNLVEVVSGRGYKMGLLTLWCSHTGASLLVQANADEEVVNDIEKFFDELVPQDTGRYRHKPNEVDNAPSHLRALLTQTQVSIPIQHGVLPLGKVQCLYLFEHRESHRTRRVKGHFIGQ